jgi:2-hydroxychromene-2-carboxylate isomerase
MGGSSTADVQGPGQPVFYYDLGSPHCYLLAETIMSALPVIPEWEPVLGREFDQDQDPVDREQIEREASALNLQPIRWPANRAPDTERAMLAATYAKKIGRAVAFSLAAFRQAFAGARDLDDENTILIAGAACEMHPTALRKGIDLASTHGALEHANRRAHQAGVITLPAIQVGDRVYAGLQAIHEANAGLKRLAQHT